MLTRARQCDPELLRRLLSEELSADEQSAVTGHLETCTTCCQTLETLAADDDWWADASSFLGDADDSVAGRPTRVHAAQPLSSVDSAIGDIPLDFLDPPDTPAMLGRLGEYDILEPIGCGGMGVVLKGYDVELNRFVAVKVLAPHYATSAAARKRFAREAQAAAAVVHPHVLAIHSVDASGRLPFLVMPFVQGESLQQRIGRCGPLELKEVLRIGSQAARGLQAAHEQGLVHRDIKPGNILLENDVDRVLLTDFGLARAVDDASMTRSGVIAGTPQFMSPEQARGDAVDRRSDLFSLGSVLYTMCAGRPPFRAETTMGLLRRIVETKPRPIREVNPDVPEWLGRIIETLHAGQPEDRLTSAGELADLLEQCLAHVQQPTTVSLPESLRRLKPHGSRRRRILAAMAAAGVVVALLINQVTGPGPETQNDPAAAGTSTGTGVTQPDMPEPDGFIPAIDEPIDWDGDLSRELNQLHRKMERLEESIDDTERP